MREPKSATLVYAMALLAFIGAAFLALYGYYAELADYFWDMDIYVGAAREGLAGGDPYREVNGLAFVYHPLILHLFMSIERAVPLSSVLTALYFATSGWMGYEIIRTVRYILPDKSISLAYGVLLPIMVTMPFALTGIFVIETGNLTTYLHFSLIAYLLRIYRSGGAFGSTGTMVLIGMFSVVKPYFLAYILIALVKPHSMRNAFTQMALGIAVFAAIWFAGAVPYPDQMKTFLSNIAGLQSNGRVDVGINVYGLTQFLGLSKLAGLGVHVMISAILIGGFTVIAGRIPKEGRGGAALLALGYLVATLLNPRLKEYDLFPAVLFALVFWHIYCSRIYALVTLLAALVFTTVVLRYSIILSPT